MNFNPTECQVLHATRLKTPPPPIPSKDFLHSIELERVFAAKYIGVTILEDAHSQHYEKGASISKYTNKNYNPQHTNPHSTAVGICLHCLVFTHCCRHIYN